MLKITRPLGRLIFNMEIAIPGKTVFLIETAPWLVTRCANRSWAASLSTHAIEVKCFVLYWHNGKTQATQRVSEKSWSDLLAEVAVNGNLIIKSIYIYRLPRRKHNANNVIMQCCRLCLVNGHSCFGNFVSLVCPHAHPYFSFSHRRHALPRYPFQRLSVSSSIIIFLCKYYECTYPPNKLWLDSTCLSCAAVDDAPRH